MTWPRSLQLRLLLTITTLAALVWGVAAVLTWRDVRHELDELLDGHLAQAAALLVVQQAGEIEDDEGLHLPVLNGQSSKVAFQVFQGGRLTLHSANAPDAPMADTRPAEPGLRTVRVAGTDWRIFVARDTRSDSVVVVGERLDSRQDILQAVLRSALAPIGLALPLLALALAWAVHRGLAPLRALGRLLAERRPEALAPVRLDAPPTEMLPLLESLNGLLGRIEGLLQSERRFTADASHELRTPVAAIRAQAQAALGASNDAERRHALRATLAGCDRASRLIDQLLTLARLEAGRGIDLAPVELRALVRGVLAEAAPAAHAQGQVLSLEAPAEAPTLGEATLLTVLVRNLVDNALRYSPPGAQVEVVLSTSAAGTQLCLDDSGPGLDADARARLGERFFRVLGPGGSASGSGLGWSIVRRIAEAHGAALTVDAPGRLGGLAVRLDLPLA